jgi:hypothetical protein
MKRFWLPTQKGAGPGPQSQSPTKLVIENVRPGTPLYHAVAERYGGRLKQFHGKCQQDYSLSPNPLVKRRVRLGDEAIATYVNIQGQETLHLLVSPPVLEQLKKKLPEPSRNIILISFEYTNMWGVYPIHQAYLRVPALDEVPSVDAGAVRGAAVENSLKYSDDGTEVPVLSFPPVTASHDGVVHARYAEPFVTIAADGSHRSTLLFDTRPIVSLPTYVIDVYCRLNAVDPTCRLTHWSNPDQETILSEVTTDHAWEHLLGFPEPFIPVPTTVYPEDWYIPVTAAPENEDWQNYDPYSGGQTTYDPFPAVSSIDADDFPDFAGVITQENWSTSTVRLADVRHTLPSGNEPGSTFLYEQLENRTSHSIVTYTYDPVYQRQFSSASITRVASVSCAFVDGMSLGISETTGVTTVDDGTPCDPYGADQTFYGWEVTGMYPRRPLDQRLGEAVATTESTGAPLTMAGRYGASFLCRITYDRERDTLSMTTLQQ